MHFVQPVVLRTGASPLTGQDTGQKMNTNERYLNRSQHRRVSYTMQPNTSVRCSKVPPGCIRTRTPRREKRWLKKIEPPDSKQRIINNALINSQRHLDHYDYYRDKSFFLGARIRLVGEGKVTRAPFVRQIGLHSSGTV